MVGTPLEYLQVCQKQNGRLAVATQEITRYVGGTHLSAGVNNWVIKSCNLPNNFKLGAPTDNDLNKLNQCINNNMGQAILSKTKHLLNTQKCGATNNAIGSRVPRHITFTRNYLPRNHAAAHSLNAGLSEAIMSECSAVGVPLTPGTRVTRRLLKDQQNDIRI